MFQFSVFLVFSNLKQRDFYVLFHAEDSQLHHVVIENLLRSEDSLKMVQRFAFALLSCLTQLLTTTNRIKQDYSLTEHALVPSLSASLMHLLVDGNSRRIEDIDSYVTETCQCRLGLNESV